MPLQKEPGTYSDGQVESFTAKDLAPILSALLKNKDDVVEYKLKVLPRTKLETVNELDEISQ